MILWSKSDVILMFYMYTGFTCILNFTKFSNTAFNMINILPDVASLKFYHDNHKHVAYICTYIVYAYLLYLCDIVSS